MFPLSAEGPTCGVHNALGLAGGARGVEQEQWVL